MDNSSKLTKLPRLTIITVVYNAENFINDTLLSVQYNKNSLMEYIVVDGGSTDETLKHISKFKSIIDHFISEPDHGIYDAMNKGIQISTGEYICFLNAGDTLIENFYMKIEPQLNDKYDLLSFAIQIKSPSNNFSLYLPEEIHIKEYNPQHMYLPHPGLLVKRTIFEDYGLFDINYKSSADLEWINRVVIKNAVRIKYLLTPIVTFLTGGVSTSFLALKETKKIAIVYGKNPLLANYIFLKQIISMFLSSFNQKNSPINH